MIVGSEFGWKNSQLFSKNCHKSLGGWGGGGNIAALLSPCLSYLCMYFLCLILSTMYVVFMLQFNRCYLVIYRWDWNDVLDTGSFEVLERKLADYSPWWVLTSWTIAVVSRWSIFTLIVKWLTCMYSFVSVCLFQLHFFQNLKLKKLVQVLLFRVLRVCWIWTHCHFPKEPACLLSRFWMMVLITSWIVVIWWCVA